MHRWDPTSPHAQRLIEELRIALSNARHEMPRRLLRYLLQVAEGNGVLPGWGDHANLREVCKASGATVQAVIPGGSARGLVQLFCPRFALSSRPDWIITDIGEPISIEAKRLADYDARGGHLPEEAPGGVKASEEEVAWNPESSNVVELIADLRAALTVADRPSQRRLLEWLISVAKCDGVLPGYLGRPNYRRIATVIRFEHHQLNPRLAPRVLLDTFAERFLLKEQRFDQEGNPAPRTAAEDIREWLQTNPVVPSRGKIVSLRGVAELRGLPYAQIADAGHISTMIRDALAERRAVLDPRPWRPKDELIGGLPPLEAEARISELKAVVDGLQHVPENWRRRGWVDFDYIADLTGKREPTMADVPAYRRWVLAQARKKKTMLPGLMEFVDTVKGFGDWGLARIEELAKAKGNATWASEVNNQKTNYGKLLDVAGLTPDDEVGDLFGDGFDDLVVKAQAGLKGESAGNVRRGLHKWRELRKERLGSARLPASLSESLRVLLRARRMTVGALAEAVGCRRGTITTWVSERSSPSSASLDILRKVEDFFSQPRGTLLDMCGYATVNSGTGRDATEQYRQLNYRLKQLLPDEAATWPPDLLANSVEKVKPLLTAGTRQGSIVRAAASDAHLMAPFAPTDDLRRQIDEFVTYKTVPVPFPFLRSRRGHWASSASSKVRMPLIESFYRSLAQPTAGDYAKGMGIDAALASFAWMGHVPMVLAEAGRRAYRFHNEDWGDEKRGIFYTGQEEQLLEHAASITHPVTGWLTQNPQLKETLVPLPVSIPKEFCDLLQLYSLDGGLLLSEDDVRHARSDWGGYMARNHATFVQAKNHVSRIKQVSRDPIAPISGIFWSGTPGADLYECILRSERCWADQRTARRTHALDVRNSVMVRLEDQLTFRPKNLVNLTFHRDQGQIRKRDGVWEVEVPFHQFKNWTNCRLFGPKTHRRNFYQQLVDEDDLYAMLDMFFFDVMNELPRTEGDRSAFVTSGGVRTAEHDWNAIVTEFGRHHVAWNPVLGSGIPGVASLNPYAFRHITASDILNNSQAANKVEEAAFALQTSEKMILDHYGLLMPDQALGGAARTHARASALARTRMLGRSR